MVAVLNRAMLSAAERSFKFGWLCWRIWRTRCLRTSITVGRCPTVSSPSSSSCSVLLEFKAQTTRVLVFFMASIIETARSRDKFLVAKLPRIMIKVD